MQIISCHKVLQKTWRGPSLEQPASVDTVGSSIYHVGIHLGPTLQKRIGGKNLYIIIYYSR